MQQNQIFSCALSTGYQISIFCTIVQIVHPYYAHFQAAVTETLTRFMMRWLNYSCLLCQQPLTGGDPLCCRHCKTDTCFFEHHTNPPNLLRRPEISRYLRHAHCNALYACGYYQWPFNQMIQNLKFSYDLRYASILARWFVQTSVDYITPLPQILLPVPLPPWRYWKRQFNQAGELSRQLSRLTGIATYGGWATRRNGKAQHTLQRSERLTNLRNMFEIRSLPPVKNVAIVDDVVTTGCTVDALAALIRRQAPDIDVQIWAMAVTPPPSRRRLTSGAPTDK